MRFSFFLVLLNCSCLCFSQESTTTSFLKSIAQYDVSYLWLLDSFQIENDTIIVKRDEPIGFIGDNYQRFYIHFISAIRDASDSLLYHIYGKSKVRDNICSFQGSIRITDSQIYTEQYLIPLTEGYFEGEYNLLEDPKAKHSGKLNGKFRTDFYTDGNGRLHYGALNYSADGFSNNEFEGTWTSYETNQSKKCNWGDYRIPNSKMLDEGAAEFYPNEKFHDFGWKNYSPGKDEEWWRD